MEKLWNGNGPQDSEQVIPGFIQHGLNFSDYAVAMAPRPITMLTATRDMFPIEGARAQHAEAQRLFALLGAKEKAGFFEYDDGHGWSQPRRTPPVPGSKNGFDHRPTSAPEPADLQPEAQKTLTCTETGFTVTALNSKTSQRLNQDWAEEIFPGRKLGNVTNAEKARDVIAARLAIPRARPAGRPLRRRQTRSGLVGDEVIITSVTGAQIQVILHLPSGSGARQPAVIVLRDDAAPGPADSDPEVAAWRKAGYVVAVAQLPGVDRTPVKPNNYYSMRYRTAMRAILVGKTMAGIHTNDLLAVFDVVSARPEVDSGKVSILGHWQPRCHRPIRRRARTQDRPHHLQRSARFLHGFGARPGMSGNVLRSHRARRAGPRPVRPRGRCRQGKGDRGQSAVLHRPARVRSRHRRLPPAGPRGGRDRTGHARAPRNALRHCGLRPAGSTTTRQPGLLRRFEPALKPREHLGAHLRRVGVSHVGVDHVAKTLGPADGPIDLADFLFDHADAVDRRAEIEVTRAARYGRGAIKARTPSVSKCRSRP